MVKRMPIAKLNPADRGVRQPGHEFGGVLQRKQLYPLAVAPVLPGETLAGGVIRGRTACRRMVQPASAPRTWTEVAAWYVPLSAYPQWMTQAVVNDAEDGRIPDTPDAINAQGHLSVGTQNRVRIYAGEIGDEAAGGSLAAYLPWTSMGMQQIKMWYEDESTDEAAGIDITDDDLLQQPPHVGHLIRGALPAGISTDVGNDLIFDDTLDANFNRSIGEWAERLTILSRPDQTYPEYLASHGINPRRVGGIPHPISYKLFENKMQLESINVPAGVFDHGSNIGDNAYANNVRNTFSSHRLNDVMGAGTTHYLVGDPAGLGYLGSEFTMRLPGGMFFDEPGFIFFTGVWYQAQVNLGQFSEHITANRILEWPTGGISGYDEIEFLKAQQLNIYDAVGGTPTEDTGGAVTEEGRSTNRMFNLLNLFLYGDSFNNNLVEDPFSFRGMTGEPYPSSLHEFYIQADAELGILSHLVNAS